MGRGSGQRKWAEEVGRGSGRGSLVVCYAQILTEITGHTVPAQILTFDFKTLRSSPYWSDISEKDVFHRQQLVMGHYIHPAS